MRDAVTVARDLIGCELVHASPEGVTSGIIVETEAYRQDDEASHSFRGSTPRNSLMFEKGGRAYVYFTYGAHYCFNVVCGEAGYGEAVLIRALEPTNGLDLMEARRMTMDLYNLCSGPGKLVQAMGLGNEHNGASLTSQALHILPGEARLPTACGPRIGISKATDKPWRFIVAGSPYITKHKFNKLTV